MLYSIYSASAKDTEQHNLILSLFGLLLIISLVMIFIGLTRPSESAQALIGFSFLFILSLVMLLGNLEYETGSIVSNSFAYTSNGSLSGLNQTITYQNTNWNDNNAHFVGFWLAVISFLSFIFTLMSIGRYNKMTPE
jgi:hypothetical protein